MRTQIKEWADIIAKMAVPFLIAILTLMWQSGERHQSEANDNQKHMQESIMNLQLQVAQLSTQITTGIHDRMDAQDHRLTVIETHQDKQDDRINGLETRR